MEYEKYSKLAHFRKESPMEQVQDGLYRVEEKMPCAPGNMRFIHYALPSLLGKFEPEEAAARILSFSQQLDQWVGVSWPKLAEMMKGDYELEQRARAARDEEREEQRRVWEATKRYNIFCVISLGVYAFLHPKPTAKSVENPTEKIPFSGIFVFGSRHVIDGVHDLIEKGLLRHAQEGEGENAIDVFFPTPELARIVARAS